MTRRRLPSIFVLGLLAASALSAAGCGPEQDAQSPESVQGLPPWLGHDQTVFDDGIDPEAVGLSMEARPPKGDPLLRERALTADVVARVKVTTVTVESVGDDSTVHLGILVGDPPLRTPKIPEQRFELLIRPSGRAFGIAKAFDARLQGLIFVGFLKRFVGAGGEPEIHWHLSADTPEVVAAVKDAVALAELSGL
ncbi:MAG: cobalamin ABC transporter substrate-binding protein [Polyangiaceae bacterium]|nr:cobalamin ABC transporter substrate-binding protein [Polyangiaceae bacterium]